MTTIRKIVTSKIDGDNANNTSTSEVRPFGELAVYIDTENNGGPDKLELLMFDGARTHLRSKVLSKGTFYGGDADSADQGDGIENFDTIKLIPDAELHYNDSDYGNDQYLIIDPTAGSPGHIHIRAGGAIDNSSADLYLGGEQTFVRVSDTTDNVAIRTGLSAAIENVKVWTVDELVPPGDVWRLFINDSTYPTLGTTVQIGETVTTTWGTPVTATIVDIQQDAGKWQIHVDQDITAGFANDDTVTFNRGSKTWTFGNAGNLTVPANSSILTNETALKIATHSTTTYTFNQAYWEALNGNATRMLTITGNAQYFSCTVTANQDGTYTVADLTGNSFEPGDWFKVPGNELGGVTPANDIQINIATVDGEGVILTTTITGTAVGKQWQFGTDGELSLPNNAVIRTDGNNVEVGNVTNFNVEAEGVVNIYTDTNGVTPFQWQFGDDGAITFPDGTTTTGESITLPVNQSLTVTVSHDEPPPGHTNTFKINPESIKLPTGNGTIFSGTETAANAWHLDSANKTLFFPDAGDGVFPQIKYSTTGNDGMQLFTAAKPIKITVEPNNWTFGTDGALTLPTAGKIVNGTISAIGDTRIIATNSSGGVTPTNPEFAEVAYSATILSTYSAGDTITLNNGNVRTITSVTSGGGGGYITISWSGPSNSNPAFPLTLTTSDYEAARPNEWTFGTNSTLTFPNNTIQSTAWAGIPGPYANDAAAAVAGVAVNYPYHKTGTSGQVFVRLV